MLRNVPTEHRLEKKDDRFLLYLVAGISAQLHTMQITHPSLEQDSRFTALYGRILRFYESFEGGDVGAIQVSHTPPDTDGFDFHAGYSYVAAKLGKKGNITLKQIEELYNLTVRELKKIIIQRGNIIPIGETTLRLPAPLTQSFERFKSGIDKSDASDYFEEALDAASDSLILGELEELKQIIERMRDDVWDRIAETLENVLIQYEGDEPDDVIVPDTEAANAEIRRLMTLTDERLKTEQTWLHQVVKEAILSYRIDVRGGFAFGQGPEDSQVRAEWADRIRYRPKPTLTLIGGGAGDKSPKPAEDPTSGTSSGNTGGDAAQASVLDAA